MCDTIVNILNCNLDRIDESVLRHGFVKRSVSLRPYSECLRNKTASIKKCLPLAINKCKQSNIRALKTIRFGAYMLDRLLKLDRGIQIVYYVRDPRGMLQSISSLGYIKSEPWATSQCYRMHEDRKHVLLLNQTVNILYLRYEDLATAYRQTTKMIYSFINRSTPDDIINWFGNNTNNSRDGGIMGTSRANSTATAHKWRDSMPKETKHIVETICENVLHENGFWQLD